MHDLQAITPLGHYEAARIEYGPVCVEERTDVSLASVAVRPGQSEPAAKVLKTFVGTALPLPQRVAAKKVTAFWTGPDQWMIESSFESDSDLAARLAAKASGMFSVTEQTDAWCRFDVTGESLPTVFERLCAVNTRAFLGGEVQRTSMDHIGCFLICRDQSSYSIYAPRSSAGSLFHAIETTLKAIF